LVRSVCIKHLIKYQIRFILFNNIPTRRRTQRFSALPFAPCSSSPFSRSKSRFLSVPHLDLSAGNRFHNPSSSHTHNRSRQPLHITIKRHRNQTRPINIKGRYLGPNIASLSQ
jgi:hypothetical protein